MYQNVVSVRQLSERCRIMRMLMSISFYQALRQAEEVPTLGRGSAKVRPFVEFIQKFRSQIEYLSVKELLEKLIEETGYVNELEAEDTDEAKARIENIDELISKAASYEDEGRKIQVVRISGGSGTDSRY